MLKLIQLPPGKGMSVESLSPIIQKFYRQDILCKVDNIVLVDPAPPGAVCDCSQPAIFSVRIPVGPFVSPRYYHHFSCAECATFDFPALTSFSLFTLLDLPVSLGLAGPVRGAGVSRPADRSEGSSAVVTPLERCTCATSGGQTP